MSIDWAELPTFERVRLSDAERHKNMIETRAARPAGEAVWMFGFGSLMWNPCFDFDARESAFLSGYERKFHIWTMRARGTPERPGLGLCLEDCAGGCRGIAYRLSEDKLDEAFERLWEREMGSGIYKPTWVAVDTDNFGRVPALTFVVNRDHPHYAGPLPNEAMCEIMAGACGTYGRCRDYLAGTIEEMQKLGVSDPELENLLAAVDACGQPA